MVALSELSRSGGVINAYEAIKLASVTKGEKKAPAVIKPTTTIKPKPKG
jgi:hypothetical protein